MIPEQLTVARPTEPQLEQLKAGWAKLPEVLKLMKFANLRKV